MSAENVAEREADYKLGFQEGIVHAFSALLSDEAVEAAAFGLQPRLDEYPYTESDRERYRGYARAALQAAVRAVTEGDRK